MPSILFAYRGNLITEMLTLKHINVMNFTCKEIAYLLGCYIVIADNEINEFEVDIIDEYLPLEGDPKIYRYRQEIFSDVPDRIKPEFLLQYLRTHNYSAEQKVEILTFIAKTAFADDYVSPAEKDLIDKVQSALNYSSKEYYDVAESESISRLQKNQLNVLQKIVGNIENTLYDKFADKDKTKIADWLFGSLGYSATLEKITYTATNDLERIIKIVSTINSSLRSTQEKLLSTVEIKRGASKEVREVANIVE